VPVISAVGHEVDVTIADFVADVRAATPSNAAELVVERADHVRGRIDRAHDRLRRAVLAADARRRQRLDRGELRLHRWPVRIVLRDRDVAQARLRLQRAAAARLQRAAARFDALRRRLERRDVRRIVAEIRTRLVRADGRLRACVETRRHAAAARAVALSARLDALSPLAVLGRGYAVCWDGARERILRSTAGLQRGDDVRVTLAAGELDCRVETVWPAGAPAITDRET
jgi:exodeoxyribonuclease VII large subunit